MVTETGTVLVNETGTVQVNGQLDHLVVTYYHFFVIYKFVK